MIESKLILQKRNFIIVTRTYVWYYNIKGMIFLNNSYFIKKINEILKIKDISLYELSKRSNINILMLLLVLKFGVKKIKLTKAINICNCLDISISELFK